MTTNLQFEEYCKEINIKLNGIYNKDNLPYLAKRKDGFYIVNSQDEYNLEGEMNGGIHWVCFVVEGKECCYMDSFGGEPYRQIQEFAPSKVVYSKEQIQDINSSRCGEFCVWFGYCCLKKYKKVKGLHNRLMLFLNDFDKENLKENDNIIKENFSSLHIKV